MKKTVKILSLLMAIAMVCCCFAACGSDSNSSEAESAEGTLIIGCSGPLTGDASSYGISVKKGAQLAVDEINKAGGINGIKLTFNMKDDAADATKAATAYDALMDSGMLVSIGSVTSGACESFAAKSVDDNLFFITPSASNAEIIKERDNGFRVCFGDPDQGILAADELVTNKGYKNIGAIYDTSDSYSSGVYEAFEGEMKKLNAEFTTKTFDAENNKDFSVQVEALKDCDAIFLPFYYTEAGLVAKACAAKGVNAELFGCDGLDGVADQIDSSVTNTVRYITPFDVESEDAKVADFVKAYNAKYDTNPDQFAADGYDAIYVIFEALKKANFDSVDVEVSDLCETLKSTITDSSFKFTGVTGEMTWSKDGAPTKAPIIKEVVKK